MKTLSVFLVMGTLGLGRDAQAGLREVTADCHAGQMTQCRLLHQTATNIQTKHPQAATRLNLDACTAGYAPACQTMLSTGTLGTVGSSYRHGGTALVVAGAVLSLVGSVVLLSSDRVNLASSLMLGGGVVVGGGLAMSWAGNVSYSQATVRAGGGFGGQATALGGLVPSVAGFAPIINGERKSVAGVLGWQF